MTALNPECSTRKDIAVPITKKIIMAGTGLSLVAFLVIHLVGNLTFFAGPDGINVYAKTLHSVPIVVWLFRSAIALILVFHVWYAIKLTLENNAARPVPYAKRVYQKSTVLSRSMIWTGLTVLTFLVYHILQFTLQCLDPLHSAAVLRDGMGRPDVYKMMVSGFSNPLSLAIYLIGLSALAVHLSHGLHSAMLSIGLATRRALPVWVGCAALVAVVFFVAFLSIPAGVFSGIMK